MSGFKDDVLSILKANHILQKESIGLVALDGFFFPEVQELYDYLVENKYIVVSKRVKEVINFDYIVFPLGNYSTEDIIYALSNLSVGGIIVLEVSGIDWNDRYISRFGGFTANKVKFNGTYYVVIHGGMDYGD